jgi:hypothetical protein
MPFDDDAFLTGDNLMQAGSFLDPGPARVIYTDDEAQEEAVKAARSHYEDLAALASLEQHPGYAQILKMIDACIEKQNLENENLMRANDLSTEKVQMNLYAVVQLKDLRDSIVSKIGEYREMIREEEMLRAEE